jgi:hypothetical protein
MQIGAQGIENMFITSIICNMVFKKNKNEKTYLKRNLSIPFKTNFILKFILIRQDD